MLNRHQLCTRGKWFGLLWNVIVRVVVRRMKYNGGGGCSSAIERMLCKLSAESFFRPSSYMMKKVFPPLLFSYNQYRDLMTGHEGKTMSSYVKGIPGNCGSWKTQVHIPWFFSSWIFNCILLGFIISKLLESNNLCWFIVAQTFSSYSLIIFTIRIENQKRLVKHQYE